GGPEVVKYVSLPVPRQFAPDSRSVTAEAAGAASEAEAGRPQAGAGGMRATSGPVPRVEVAAPRSSPRGGRPPLAPPSFAAVPRRTAGAGSQRRRARAACPATGTRRAGPRTRR